jgi:hypothetical protein
METVGAGTHELPFHAEPDAQLAVAVLVVSICTPLWYRKKLYVPYAMLWVVEPEFALVPETVPETGAMLAFELKVTAVDPPA